VFDGGEDGRRRVVQARTLTAAEYKKPPENLESDQVPSPGDRTKSATVAAVCPSHGACPVGSTFSRACGMSSVTAWATETPPSGSCSPHTTSVGIAS
jgi:hypothetical protein